MIFMLKAYPIKDLQAGMVVGRPVYDESTTETLLGKGTILTAELISLLAERTVFTVYVEELDGIRTMPRSMLSAEIVEAIAKVNENKSMKQTVREGSEHILDSEYVTAYKSVYSLLEGVYGRVRTIAEIDVQAVRQVVESKEMAILMDSSMAISQLHNMDRDGDYLLHHCIHVGILAGLMGKWINWAPKLQKKLLLSGLLIDVGKLRMSQMILEKSGPLTEMERNVIKRHAALGYEMLRYGPLREEYDVLNGILQHHERNDGSGYPEGLKREQISDFGKVLAIIDMYDAMASNRSYARRKSPFAILRVIADDVNHKKLDTMYGVIFIKNMGSSMTGSWVRLTDGSKAKIVFLDDNRLDSLPIVQREDGKFVDLNTFNGVDIAEMLTYSELID